jgi:dsRNA-specific ribonuclease
MTFSANRSILSGNITHRSLIKDKGLSRLGDSITNLVFSIAISLVLKKPEGGRASDKVLSQALIEAGLRHIAPKRAGSDQLGDIAESLIASAWLNHVIEIEDAAGTVASEFSETDLKDKRKEDQSAIRGFKRLLERITQDLGTKLIDEQNRHS